MYRSSPIYCGRLIRVSEGRSVIGMAKSCIWSEVSPCESALFGSFGLTLTLRPANEVYDEQVDDICLLSNDTTVEDVVAPQSSTTAASGTTHPVVDTGTGAIPALEITHSPNLDDMGQPPHYANTTSPDLSWINDFTLSQEETDELLRSLQANIPDIGRLFDGSIGSFG